MTQARRHASGATHLYTYSYTYDDGDNLLTKAVYDVSANSTATTTFEYNTANELTKQSVGGVDTLFSYDDCVDGKPRDRLRVFIRVIGVIGGSYPVLLNHGCH